ncbi:hypothetical protein TCE0_024r07563 [Talaromyces pinophilus]|uniref:Major facilitator superfamily (MFS) profile domain-containing protein n=1 Tax=Talaromyces pinophilus TaxID=128442 RepID=A0A6V8H8F2_TALPI|nr:hypothetical protein TCE0_024r07563 [Talaromyces pinophilus]
MATNEEKPEHFMINDADTEAHDGPHGAKPTAIADTLGASGAPNPLGKGHLRLYALCAIVYLCSTMNATGYDGSLMGSINSLPEYLDYYNQEQSSASTGLVFSIFQVGQMVASLFIWICDWRGRKICIIGGCLGVCGSAIFTALAPSLGSFIGARFLLSFFSTIAYVAAPLLLVEIAPPLHRGKVAGVYNTLYYMGSIIATFAIYGCNRNLHGNLKWRLPLWLQILCPGLVIVGGYFIPESPRWLVTKGREAEARAFIVEISPGGGIRSARDYFDLRSLVRKRSSRYRLMLAIAMAWFGQFSGNNIASYYLPLLVKNVGITSTNTVLLMNAIYAVAGWIAATTGAFFHDVWGRRKMLMGSCIGMAVSLAIVAATAADYVHTGSHPSSYASIVFIYIFGVVFAFSFTPMQPIYPAEVLSNNMRANGMMVFQITAGCSSFVNTYAAPVALDNIKYWFYVFFVFWDLFEATVIYFFFVETKDRTLEELDEVFEAKNPRKASTRKTEKTVQNPRRISSAVAAPKRDRVLNVVVAAFVVTIAPLPVGSVYGTRCLTSAIILPAGHGGRHLAFRELSNSRRSLQTVISTLFPSTPINELDGLSRDQLVDLLQKAPTSETASNDPEAPASDLFCLEPPPERDFTWDEVSDEEMPKRRVADDVNGLSLFIEDSRSSYLGLTSIPAILRVMTNISPQIRSSISKRSQQSEGMSHPSKPVIPAKPSNPKTNSDELRLIDAYFFYVHGITPMIDEVDFRRRYAEGVVDQNKGPWIALVNMVLAMGYIASSMSDQDGHSVYYKRAAEHLNFRCLGSGHIDTVQALTILGGYYLHYLNRPNMASAILGATIRMAVAIGLHRVPFQPRQNGHRTPEDINMIDTRARTWLSLFCLDTWGAATLGRPSFWRGNLESVTIASLPARRLSDTGPQDLPSISLNTSISFCKIATRIQDRLVQLPLITPAEIEKLDSELMSWHASLPAVFIGVNECPPQLRVARGVLRWRFLTLRLTLYRPYALIQSLQVYSQQETDKTETSLVTACRAIAKEVIETIKLDWFPNQICAWNSVWYLFQACLVVLLSVISEPDSDARPEWDRTIRETVDMLHEMTAWSPGAARSREVICFLYEAQGTKATSPAGETPNLFDFESSFWNFFDLDQLSADTGWDQSLFPGLDALGTAAWSLM